MNVHHLALRADDVATLVAFYRELFGLRVAREREGSVWLVGDGDAVLMIERRGEGEPAIPAASHELIALRVDRAGRDAFRARCREQHVAIEHETEHTTYVRDPEGRRVAVSTHPLLAPGRP